MTDVDECDERRREVDERVSRLSAVRRSRNAPVSASFAQQRLWLLSQLEPNSPTYNCPILTRLRGRLDVDALTESLATIVRRHEVLRTTFSIEDGQLLQMVHPSLVIALSTTDVSGLPSEEQEVRVEQVVADETLHPFDLARGPVVRLRLLRLSRDEHIFIFNVHHIAFDAWSVHVYLRELAAGYNAHRRRIAPELPELPIQYADYSIWQRERIKGTFLEKQLNFWRQNLEGIAPLDLPTDRPHPDSVAFKGSSQYRALDPEAVAALVDLARQEGASAFMALLALNAALLSRYSGQDDVAIGTGIAQRERPEVQGLLGFFPNTIVLRIDLAGRPTYRQLLGRVRAAAFNAYAYSEAPFDLVVQELRPRRDVSGTPFFRIYFALDDTSATPPDFDGLDVALGDPQFLAAKFDLAFNVSVSPIRPGVYGVFSTDVFDPATIDRLLGHYATLLEAAVTNPDRPVSEIPLLTEAERHQVFVEWNDTTREFPDDLCLHQLFEAQADRIPDAPAIVCGRQTLSYDWLEARANQVAHRLRSQRVGPESVVGIYLPRSPDQVVAILGVLKAGGAYLPLDLEYPADRLALMLRSSGSWGVVTYDYLRPNIPGVREMRTLCLDVEAHRGESTPRPDVAVDPENLAYVIYTSGSTGAPKGIALRHRGAVNNFTDFVARTSIGPGDSVLAVSSPSFDMSVFDVLGMLGAGASVVLPEPSTSRDPAAWARLLRENGVTVWHSAPALLELLLESLRHDGDRPLPALRVALLGGDWIPLALPDRLWAVAPDAQFISLGGATEASMDSIIFPVERIDPNWSTIPYGRPMGNQRAYILDRNLQPLPVGVPGELHLAGVGLARGYLGRPELTAERFVEHTFEGGVTERLYKTGDLARYRADGVIELLGRMDFRVKVHGVRIELQEIESALRRHDDVEDGVAVARQEGSRTWLAAFYVPRAGSDISGATLRHWLARFLPSYMVPATFVQLDRLPTTPNGKVDRRALTTWEVASAGQAEGGLDEYDERVMAAWRDVLGTEQFSIDDNFFELGGDSFAAIRAALAFDGALPVVEFFKNATVRGLAAYLRAAQRGPARLLHQLTDVQGTPRLNLVCVPYGGGNAIAYQPLASQLPAGFALWSVALPGHDPTIPDEDFLPIEEAARRCADEIEKWIEGPIAVYGQCAGVAMAIEVASEIEERGLGLRTTYLGAALPDSDPEYSLQREPSTTDEMIYGLLCQIGGFDGPLSKAALPQILRAVRSDLLQSSRFFLRSTAAPPRKLRSPLRCVFGDADPATKQYERRVHEWERYAESVEMAVIPGGGHYFVRTHAAELAALLGRYHPVTEQEHASANGSQSRATEGP